MHAGENIPLRLRRVSFDSVALLLYPIHIATQKASVGMYSECDFPTNLICDPAIPKFILQSAIICIRLGIIAIKDSAYNMYTVGNHFMVIATIPRYY